MVSMSEWISVKDRMPQDFVSVLGCMRFAGPYPAVRECYVIGGKHFFFPALRSVEAVTHWMPMPEQPKETEEGDTDV